ncbi:MAG: hydroxylamine reductase [Proteobacteria bacterium]|nr:hydroxylamine reductase [Pseudomonadota bacterium]
MFCHQCQETAMNTGCNMKRGVCGKPAEIADLQDLFIWVLKGISVWGVQGKEVGVYDEATAFFIDKGLFMTITNANFSKSNFVRLITEGVAKRDELKEQVMAAWKEQKGTELNLEVPECATWTPENEEALIAKSESGAGGWMEIENEDIRSLRALVLYGLKGMSAYLEHAYQVKKNGKEIFEYLMEGLAALVDDSLSADDLVALVMKTGEVGVKAMALLDEANTYYGHQEISEVNLGVRDRPGILISGHDFVDLKELLEQTKDKGIDIYTHGEMLPAHYRPGLKKYEHLYANYGDAWYLQKSDIENFGGPVLFTSNCLVPPKDEHKSRIFTSGPVGFEGCAHIPDRPDGGHKDFAPIINLALKSPSPKALEEGTLVGGFGHNQVLALADKVISAVKAGKIKRFVVMAGCDGRQKSRSYFTEVAQKLPEDAVILTAGCAKFRYIKLQLGDIDGIPRVLDAGQCNDSYSLAVIALELQKAFELNDINDLPLSFDIAWYEQKAVLVLLALLHLGVKGIRLGPTLPGFLSPAIANTLVEKFDLKPIAESDVDVAAMMAG